VYVAVARRLDRIAALATLAGAELLPHTQKAREAKCLIGSGLSLPSSQVETFGKSAERVEGPRQGRDRPTPPPRRDWSPKEAVHVYALPRQGISLNFKLLKSQGNPGRALISENFHVEQSLFPRQSSRHGNFRRRVEFEGPCCC
jgi:hypothetical protein